MCYFHDKLWSSKIPRNFIVLTLSMSSFFIFNVGRWEGMLYFLPDLWNREKLFFSTFNDCLFAKNHSLILIDLSLTVLNNVFMLMFMFLLKKLVSSANIIGIKTFEELGRSFAYNKNKIGPSIEPCSTPHLISFFTVSADFCILFPTI